MIDRATQERIKEAADIVDVVGDYVHLVRRGSNLMGLCPFHNEKTPSFSVNRRKNFCWCFSCKKGGSPVNFLMIKEGLSYPEALRALAKRYGIKIEERDLTDEERIKQTEREAMYVANEWAMKRMETDMRDTEEGQSVGLQYFYQRGVTEEAIRQFHLGYAIDNGQHLTKAARNAGLDMDVMQKVGLIGKSERGNEYDRFRGRVIFPIINQGGKVVAFGGRDLKGGLAKYINSPESLIYNKSYQLYGIHQAKGTIINEDKCFIVEGYMDVIGMWQAGMKNVVASCGTALTDEQIALIRRLTKKITLLYDGDAPGIKAALRGIDMLLSAGMDTKVLLLPDGEDPDSFAKNHTPEEFKRYVAEHETDVIRFKAQVMLGDVADDPIMKADAVKSVVDSIACVPDRIMRDIYVQECARIMNMTEETIAASLRDSILKKEAEARKRRNIEDLRNIERAEQGSGTPVENNPQQPPLQPQPSQGTVQSPAQTPANRIVAPETVQGAVREPVAMRSPFYRLEETLVRYLVKFGMMSITHETDENGNTIDVTVLDFVKDEMDADGISFSIAVFDKLYSTILTLSKAFTDNWERLIPEIEIEIQQLRQNGFDAIAQKNLDMASIEIEEKRLEETLLQTGQQRKEEFSRDYLEKALINHEDDDVRIAATNLIVETHQLSNIYLKNGNVERDEDRLGILVPRALIEWKTEILDQKLKGCMAELIATDPADNERVEQLQEEINKIVSLRSMVAKSIGDRILAPMR